MTGLPLFCGQCDSVHNVTSKRMSLLVLPLDYYAHLKMTIECCKTAVEVGGSVCSFVSLLSVHAHSQQ